MNNLWTPGRPEAGRGHEAQRRGLRARGGALALAGLLALAGCGVEGDPVAPAAAPAAAAPGLSITGEASFGVQGTL